MHSNYDMMFCIRLLCLGSALTLALAMSINSNSNRYSWRFDRLLWMDSAICKEILAQLDRLLLNGEVQDRLSELALFAERGQSFKEETRNGVIWQKGRGVDGGNYFYSTVFLLLLWWSRRKQVMVATFNKIIARWQSLHPNAPCTDASRSRKGDVIEFVLHPTYLTGLAIPSATRLRRLEIQQIFRDMVQTHERLDKLLFTCELGGPPKVAQRPCVRLYSCLLIYACELHTNVLPPHGVVQLREGILLAAADHHDLV